MMPSARMARSVLVAQPSVWVRSAATKLSALQTDRHDLLKIDYGHVGKPVGKQIDHGLRPGCRRGTADKLIGLLSSGHLVKPHTAGRQSRKAVRVDFGWLHFGNYLQIDMFCENHRPSLIIDSD